MRELKNRIRLRWNRNMDSTTRMYRVYRSAYDDVDRTNRMVMVVDHPAQTKWVHVEQQVANRVSNIRWELEHDTLNTDFEVLVYLNGEPANHLLREIDYIDGEVLFKQPPADDAVVTATYEFDGIEVIDDVIEQENMIEYHGPPAVDKNAPVTPDEITIVPLPTKNGVKVTWTPTSTGGQPYFYRVEATDGAGNFSSLSKEEEVILDGGLAQKGYVVERSTDGERWAIVSQTHVNEYHEFGIDSLKPTPVQIKEWYAKEVKNQSKGEVFFDLVPYKDITQAQPSPMYRVYARSSFGAISEPTNIVGPVYIKIPIKKIIVLRQHKDTLTADEIPTPTNPNATFVAEFEDLNECRLWDYPSDNSAYRYAFYAVDELDNLSMATTVDVEIDNATPPTWEDDLTIRKFPLIV